MPLTVHNTETTGFTVAMHAGAGAQTGITGTKPSALASGDLLVAIISQQTGINPYHDITPPAGFVEVISGEGVSAQYSSGYWVAYKAAGGSEPGTYAFTYPSLDADTILTLIRVSGANNGGTILDGTPARADADATLSPVCTSLDMTVADTVAFWVVVSTAYTVITAADTGPFPSGTTGLMSRKTRDHSNAANLGIAFQAISATGATGTRTWTSYLDYTGSAGSALSFGFQPASGGGGGGVPASRASFFWMS